MKLFAIDRDSGVLIRTPTLCSKFLTRQCNHTHTIGRVGGYPYYEVDSRLGGTACLGTYAGILLSPSTTILTMNANHLNTG